MSLRVLGLFLGGVVALIAAASVVSRLVRSFENEVDLDNEDLVTDLLAENLSSRLSRSRQALLAVLRGESDDPELRRRIDSVLRSVDLIFQRTGRPGTAELRIHVNCRNGETFGARVERAWEELPARVREGFLRNERSSVTLAWTTPWAHQE
jgi:hypothetical protein